MAAKKKGAKVGSGFASRQEASRAKARKARESPGESSRNDPWKGLAVKPHGTVAPRTRQAGRIDTGAGKTAPVVRVRSKSQMEAKKAASRNSRTKAGRRKNR